MMAKINSDVGVTPTTSHNERNLTREELQFLQSLMARMGSSSSASIAGPTFASSLSPQPFSYLSSISHSNSTSWIIDSGASEHMTGSLSGFTKYCPLSEKEQVKTVDGSFSLIAGI